MDRLSMPPMQVHLLEALKVYSMVWLPQFKIFSRVFSELLVVFWVKKEKCDNFEFKQIFRNNLSYHHFKTFSYLLIYTSLFYLNLTIFQ